MNLHDEKTLREVLTFTYRVMVASCDLIACAQCAIENPVGDTPDAKLYAFYQVHAGDERGHDEWLLSDLDDDIPNEIDFTAACIAGTQYYLIRHVHPALLLGYMQALENPTPLSLIEELEAVHGKKLLRTWRHHAEVDGEHLKEIEEMIALMPDELKTKIEQNRQATLTLWNSTLKRYDHGNESV